MEADNHVVGGVGVWRMSHMALGATGAVCVLAAAGTAWLGYASGLFRLDSVGSGTILATLVPYLVLAFLALGHRRHPARVSLVFAITLLVSGYGLFFFYQDWSWPQPTNPNPWRAWMLPVVIIPQWAVVGLAALVLTAHHLWATRGAGARRVSRRT